MIGKIDSKLVTPLIGNRKELSKIKKKFFTKERKQSYDLPKNILAINEKHQRNNVDEL